MVDPDRSFVGRRRIWSPPALAVEQLVLALTYIFVCLAYILYVPVHIYYILSLLYIAHAPPFSFVFPEKNVKIFSGNFLGMWLCLSGKWLFFIWQRPLFILAPLAPFVRICPL